jgi:hypothetical protein
MHLITPRHPGLLLFILVFTTVFPLSAQDTGPTELPHLGLSFDVPEGWMGQASGNAYIMGTPDGSGFVLITGHPHQHLDQLSGDMAKGTSDGRDTELRIEGQLEPIGQNGLGANYTGQLAGIPAKAYIVGLINPHGRGISIVSMQRQDPGGPDCSQTARAIAGTVRFTPARPGAEADEWREKLGVCRLSSFESYLSGSSGGYNAETVIHLCSESAFSYQSTVLVGADAGMVSGSSGGTETGEGHWEIAMNFEGRPVLRLFFSDTSEREYVLASEGDRLMLDGRPFIRSTGAHGPECR